MDAGELVPDELVIGIIRERLGLDDIKQSGVLLDGFPRTIVQADALQEIMDATELGEVVVINIAAGDDALIRRLAGRRMCRDCDAIFHIDRDGVDAGDECPECGGEIYQRSDDQEEAIAERIRTYHAKTAPLIEYYTEKGLLIEIDGSGTPDEVNELVMAELG